MKLKHEIIKALKRLKSRRNEHLGICLNIKDVLGLPAGIFVQKSLQKLYETDNDLMLDESPGYDQDCGLWKGVNLKIRLEAIDKLIAYLESQ